MYNEHPIKILKYSKKSLWLLVFPVIRGIYAATLDVNRLYTWLKGVWFDVAALGIILLFGLIRWRLSVIGSDGRSVFSREGIFIIKNTEIRLDKLSSFVNDEPFYYRLIGAARMCCNTCSGAFRDADMIFVLRKKDLQSLFRDMNHRDQREIKMKKVSFFRTLELSCFLSSSLSGAGYIALFLMNGRAASQDVVFESVDKIVLGGSGSWGGIVSENPSLFVIIGAILIALWLISFFTNVFRYADFSYGYDKNSAVIRCGLISKKYSELILDKVNYADMQQGFMMKLFRLCILTASCSGYGESKNRIPVIVPVCRIDRMKKQILHKGENISVKPMFSSFIQYVWQPLLFITLVVTACAIGFRFLQNRMRILFLTIAVMLVLPFIRLLVCRIVSLFTNKIGIYEDLICISCNQGFRFHNVIALRKNIVKVIVRQTPFQRLSGKINVSFCFTEEKGRKYVIKGLKESEVRKLNIIDPLTEMHLNK